MGDSFDVHATLSRSNHHRADGLTIQEECNVSLLHDIHLLNHEQLTRIRMKSDGERGQANSIARLSSLSSLLGDELVAKHLGGKVFDLLDAVCHLDTTLKTYFNC